MDLILNLNLFLYFTVHAGLSLTGTLSVANRVKTDECEEKLKVIVQRQKKNLMVQTDVALTVKLYILYAILSLHIIYTCIR